MTTIAARRALNGREKRLARTTAGLGLDPEALLRRAGRERNAILAERLASLGWHLQHYSRDRHAMSLLLEAAVASLVLDRPDDARALAATVVRELDPRKKSFSAALTEALAMLVELDLRAGRTPETRLLEETSCYPAACWKELAGEIGDAGSLADVVEKPVPAALRAGALLILQGLAACHLKDGASVAGKVRTALDQKVLPALRARLTSKRDLKQARTILAFDPPASPAPTKLPAVLAPRSEKNAALRRLLERLAKKPSLRSSKGALDVLAVGLGRLALGRPAAALETLTPLAELAYGGDLELWTVVGKAMAVRARLAADQGQKELAARDRARLDWQPFSSMGGDWLDRQAKTVAELELIRIPPRQRPTDLVLCRLTHALGWAAFAGISDGMRGRLSTAAVDGAWRAGLAALGQLLTR